MQIIHAQMTAQDHEMVVAVEPITIGEIEYHGCKIVHLKDVKSKDEQGNERTKQVPDETKPDEYDDLSQIIHDVSSSKDGLSKVIIQLAQSKMLNASLISQIAQQKKINADVIAKLAKLGGKN